MNMSFHELLQCPQCHGTIDHLYRCSQCNTTLERENNIWDLMPRANSLRLPRFYGEKCLQQWEDIILETHDYYYQANPILSWVQNAGHRAIAHLRRDNPSKTFLDLGCGEGGHLPYAKEVDLYVGLDFSKNSLQRFASRTEGDIRQKQTVYGDAYSLPFRDNAFDTVVNIYNLEHLVYADLCLEEISRVLRPGGIAYISVPTEGGLAWSLGRAATSKRRFNTVDLDFDRIIALEHVNCAWQLEKMIKRHFAIQRTNHFPFGIKNHNLNLITTYTCGS